MLYLVGEWGFDTWQIFGIATSLDEANKIKKEAADKGLASEKRIAIEEFEENKFYEDR